MPNSPSLWIAAGMLWVLDASINVSMEPFRALVGDMLPGRQRCLGYSMQSWFIGIGAVVASASAVDPRKRLRRGQRRGAGTVARVGQARVLPRRNRVPRRGALDDFYAAGNIRRQTWPLFRARPMTDGAAAEPARTPSQYRKSATAWLRRGPGVRRAGRLVRLGQAVVRARRSGSRRSASCNWLRRNAAIAVKRTACCTTSSTTCS